MAELVFLDDVERVPNSVVTVGTFDGVHEGHRVLVETVVRKARERDARSVIVTFDPHPREIINPGAKGIKLLTSLRERCEILEDFGIDLMVVIPFDRDFSLLSSDEFIEDIIFKKIGVSEFVIGYDHHFGKDRQGSIDTVQRLGDKLGFDAYVVSKQEVGETTVSSTTIRKTLREDGDVELARKLLGRDYRLSGTVIHGDQRGKSIGFPTANLKPDDDRKLVPKDGVYAVRTRYNGEFWSGMMNIGTRPTFSGKERTLEVHLFDFDNDIYGQDLQVRFVKRIRDEQNFNSVDELIEQLKEDKKIAQKVIKSYIR